MSIQEFELEEGSQRGEQSERRVGEFLALLVREHVIKDFNRSERFSGLDKKGIDFTIGWYSEDGRRQHGYLQVKSNIQAQKTWNTTNCQQVFCINGQAPNVGDQLRMAVQFLKAGLKPYQFQKRINEEIAGNLAEIMLNEESEEVQMPHTINQPAPAKKAQEPVVADIATEEAQEHKEKGVFKWGKNYKVQILDSTIGKIIHLGSFPTLEEANQASLDYQATGKIPNIPKPVKPKPIKTPVTRAKIALESVEVTLKTKPTGTLVAQVKALLAENKRLKQELAARDEMLREYNEIQQLLNA